MPWDSSNRRSELPTDWEQRRQTVKARAGGRCEVHMRNGSRCRDKGTECHHLGDKTDHRIEKLQWICHWHHARETAKQATEARGTLTERYPTRKHPGLR
jgi:5-methylcytosine-specific restriction protein A